MSITFPPDFDINYCRMLYPDLKNFSDKLINENFRSFAEQRGLSVCFYDKREFLKNALQNLISNSDIKVLEIGPFNNPSCVGKNVKYFDVLDADNLKKRVEHFEGLNQNTVPQKIDYVESHGDLSIVKETFNIVFSSHCIEHQPNLIRHLENVEDILEEDGLYILVIPDHRYCFDHFRKSSTIFDVIEAAVDNRINHTFKSVLENHCASTHNDALLHWQGDHGKFEITTEKFTRAADVYEKSVAADEYIDAHAWCFTPKFFREIITDLNKLGMINFEIERLCHTVWGRFEFVAILKKISTR